VAGVSESSMAGADLTILRSPEAFEIVAVARFKPLSAS